MSFESFDEISEYIQARMDLGEGDLRLEHGELNVTLAADSVCDVLAFLRDDIRCQFIALMDISGVDYPENERRFMICYHLLSPRYNMRLRLKVYTDEDTPLPSVCSIFSGAEWYEREIYDMFGVHFSDHPDMRRLLTDYGFQGYPLRKDFPVSGFVECRYDNEKKKVIYEPVRLQQEMRQFDFLSPWEAARYAMPEEKAEITGKKAEM